MVNKHIKSAQDHWSLGKIQINTTTIYHLHPPGRPLPKRQTITSVEENVEKLEP